jgi:septal ring factor EnvC (AmiA/AmiB activator)
MNVGATLKMLRYSLPIGAFVATLLLQPMDVLNSAPSSPLRVFMPLQPVTASASEIADPVPVPASPSELNGDRKPEAAIASSEASLATATAVATARLAELEAQIARMTRDVAALTSERHDLQERINALSGQTVEANQRLNRLHGSVRSTEGDTPAQQHVVPDVRHSTTIEPVRVGG